MNKFTMPVVQLETDSIELNVEEISSMNGINMYKVQFIRIDHRFAERKTRVAFEMFLAESEMQDLFSSWKQMDSKLNSLTEMQDLFSWWKQTNNKLKTLD